MILLNTLSWVVMASSLVMLMISAEEFSAHRTLRFREASQAAIIARAGETSASVALRRDAANGPEADHMREAWALAIEDDARIAGGRFKLSVSDAQAKFNLNNLRYGGLFAAGAVEAMAEALQIDRRSLEALIMALPKDRPITDLSQLRSLNLDEQTLSRLLRLVTILPEPTTININTASEEMIALLVGDSMAARRLVAERNRAGFVTSEDLAALGISLPPGVSFTSDHFWVRTEVTMGETTQVLTSLIARTSRDGAAATATIGRWRGIAPPGEEFPATQPPPPPAL